LVGADNASGERQNKKTDQILSELNTEKKKNIQDQLQSDQILSIEYKNNNSHHHITPTNQTNQEPNQKFNQPTKPIKKN